ncbi:RagB/SusD family nutrient uptake outer membrane protein [Algoriphagus aestuariicola]|uniref:RagB/SusD family nutrient uptake outer membrane protein n=1 Tax=Algoriphagus aestuariicola TaxID=1852016 RepID=A0ABS3BLB5_9BACT|nr:RagB/SusD family nutrient uptake outer membrane protein [Algoriphagus aestuariicola]MBN7800094.1 RagB/SusD family nutrient uptake outer membrane protein [Algoriphagus aestuariicola]
MKNLLYSLGICFVFSSCGDVLDIEDINNYSPELVWNDENLANAYMANLYPMFGNWNTGADRTSQQLAGIHWYDNRINTTNGEYKNWNYGRIRQINQAIVDVQAGSLPQEIKDNIIGQALFMRAYTYFDMVVYHGGVPYITVPQDRYEDDLYVPRNSTAECFEFLIRDLDDAISRLPESIATGSSDFGKIDGNFARAFKAKVLLYKASPQFNPSNPWDNAYWQEAHQANKAAYESLLAQGFGLVEDYGSVALEERNREVVFSVINSYPDKSANWDFGVRPGSESRGPASACPTWEFIKDYPMLDGKNYDDPTGAYFLEEEDFLQNYWKNRDPRFGKSIVWNGKVYEVSGKSGKRQYTSLGIAHELDDFGVNPKAATNSTNLDRYTGFFILKHSLLDLAQPEVQQYDVDYVVMRFAEVMLNYAETANETGDQAAAIQILKEIRERAGILAGTDGMYGLEVGSREQVREAILAERNIELSFEGRRFWDLRRLRMLDRLDGATKHGVEAIAINPDGSEQSLAAAREKANTYSLVEENFKYQILQIPRSGVQVSVVPETYYFFPIQTSVIDKNPNIAQNIDWGGTFDPTLE